MTTHQLLTPHQSQYYAWLLTRRAAGDTVESLASTLVDSQVDLNPHQVEAALFACRNPLSRGVILADEVGLGKTIEAGLVISQRWAERRRRILIIVPANLRKQWHQEMQDKFSLQGLILEAKNYNSIRKQENKTPFSTTSGPVICSYQFAKSKADDIKSIEWDLVVLDEAHRLRNVYKTSNVIAKTLKEALARVHSKVLLTATPLQNSLLELYGLVSMIDDRVFGDIDSFRTQFTAQPRETAFTALRARLSPVCKRTLRRQVQQYVPYTARIAIAPSLIINDRWGNPVINPEYNATQLAEALAKLEGFSYAPSETQWWQHGHSSERDFIYVTTQNLSAEQLQALSDEVGDDQSLLVCCAAFHGVTAAKASERWPNLTLKKIPKMVLSRCECGHDDYSLNVANLPMAEPSVADSLPSSAGIGKAKADKHTADLFGDGGEGGPHGEEA